MTANDTAAPVAAAGGFAAAPVGRVDAPPVGLAAPRVYYSNSLCTVIAVLLHQLYVFIWNMLGQTADSIKPSLLIVNGKDPFLREVDPIVSRPFAETTAKNKETGFLL